MLPGIKKRVFSFSDLMMYVAVGMKYARLVVLLFCLSLTAGLTYYVFAKPIWYARAVVQYRAIPLPVDAQTLYRDAVQPAILAEMTSPHIIERTAARFGVHKKWRDLQKKEIRRLRATINSEGNLELEVWPYIQDWTARWPEVWLQEYLAYREERRAGYREAAIQTFTREMANISAKMREHLETRSQYKETNEMLKVMIELNELSSVPLELARLESQLANWTKVHNSLDDQALHLAEKLSLMAALKDEEKLQIGNVAFGVDFARLPAASAGVPALPQPLQRPGGNPGVIVVPEMINSGPYESWETLDRERREIVQQMNETGRTYLPAHPKMVALRNRLQEIDKKLKAEYDAARNRFELQYARLTDRRLQLRNKLADYEAAMRHFERLQQSGTEFEAGQLAWNQMYAQLAKSVTSFDFGGDKERADLNYLGLIDIRDVVPVSPNRLKLVLLSLIAAVTLAIGLPFLFEYLDYTVNDVAEVENTLHLRGLGIVPRVMEGAAEKFPLLGAGERNARHLLENFRVIRTNLILTPPPPGEEGSAARQQVIMVASAVPKEGKTAIAANLAISFAQKGEKTLILDADLRRGRLHRLFGTRTSPGLSNVLVEDVSLDAACRPTFHENLDILTCGRHISGATEMLGTAAFEQMMKALRGRYAKIVIDTPPVLGLSETSVMQGFVDGVMFVISSEQTPMRSVKAAIELLRANGANFFGFVLNRIDLSNNANYYNYYYYSYHYYDRYQALEKVS